MSRKEVKIVRKKLKDCSDREKINNKIIINKLKTKNKNNEDIIVEIVTSIKKKIEPILKS